MQILNHSWSHPVLDQYSASLNCLTSLSKIEKKKYIWLHIIFWIEVIFVVLKGVTYKLLHTLFFLQQTIVHPHLISSTSWIGTSHKKNIRSCTIVKMGRREEKTVAEMCHFLIREGVGRLESCEKGLSYPEWSENSHLQLCRAESDDDDFDNLLKKVGLLRSWLRQLRQPPLLPAPSFEIKRKLNQKC